jgi:hypothetical protein
LNGFSLRHNLGYGCQHGLSIPLNGFLEELDRGLRALLRGLSIPLNGFYFNTMLFLYVLDSFNSIEWIHSIPALASLPKLPQIFQFH